MAGESAGMDRETLTEVAVSSVAVGLFLVVLVVVGLVYPDLAGAGGLALVGSIVLFVLVMAGAGYWLAGR